MFESINCKLHFIVVVLTQKKKRKSFSHKKPTTTTTTKTWTCTGKSSWSQSLRRKKKQPKSKVHSENKSSSICSELSTTHYGDDEHTICLCSLDIQSTANTSNAINTQHSISADKWGGWVRQNENKNRSSTTIEMLHRNSTSNKKKTTKKIVQFARLTGIAWALSFCSNHSANCTHIQFVLGFESDVSLGNIGLMEINNKRLYTFKCCAAIWYLSIRRNETLHYLLEINEQKRRRKMIKCSMIE